MTSSSTWRSSSVSAPLHFKFDLLAEFGGQIAHDARQLLPGIADRLHARLHHAFLQLGGDVREPLQRHLEVGILVAADDLEELVAGQHQLRHRGHQMIERLDVDADRVAGEPLAAFFVEPLGRGLSANAYRRSAFQPRGRRVRQFGLASGCAAGAGCGVASSCARGAGGGFAPP